MSQADTGRSERINLRLSEGERRSGVSTARPPSKVRPSAPSSWPAPWRTRRRPFAVTRPPRSPARTRRGSSMLSPIRRCRTTASARPWRITPGASIDQQRRRRVDRVRCAHHRAARKTARPGGLFLRPARAGPLLARQAGQDVRRRIARVFVCTAGETHAVLGFYTLSAPSIDLALLPERRSRKLPCHPVPRALVGRLAVDRSAHGRGFARMLLAQESPGRARWFNRETVADARSDRGCRERPRKTLLRELIRLCATR